MQAKPWWKSKTVWANVLAFAALVAERYGVAPAEYSPEQVAWIMVVLNFALRFITKQPITSPMTGAAKEV